MYEETCDDDMVDDDFGNCNGIKLMRTIRCDVGSLQGLELFYDGDDTDELDYDRAEEVDIRRRIPSGRVVVIDYDKLFSKLYVNDHFTQDEVDGFYQLQKELNVDLRSPGWQGKFVMKARMYLQSIKQGTEKEQEKVPIKQTESVEVVQEKQEILEVAMGKVSSRGYTSVLFSGLTRSYGEVTTVADFNEALCEDYFEHLRRNVNLDDLDDRYTDMYQAARWIDDTMKIAQGLSQGMPNEKLYYIPGDGLGIYSYFFRRRGLRVYSTEPNPVGSVAIKMGLIDEREEYHELLDNGDVVLVACNLPQVVDIRWQGPVVLWQQSYDHEIQSARSYLYGHLQVRGLNYSGHGIIYETVRPRKIQRVAQRLQELLRVGAEEYKYAFGTDSLDVHALLCNMNFPVRLSHVHDPSLIWLGTGEMMYDPIRDQDHKKNNRDKIFYCKPGDLFYLDGEKIVVRQMGRNVFVRNHKIIVVDFKRRQQVYPVVRFDAAGPYIKSRKDLFSDFIGLWKGRLAILRPEASDIVANAGKIRVIFKSFERDKRQTFEAKLRDI